MVQFNSKSGFENNVLKTFFSEGETEGEPFQRLREGVHNCFGVYVDTFAKLGNQLIDCKFDMLNACMTLTVFCMRSGKLASWFSLTQAKSVSARL